MEFIMRSTSINMIFTAKKIAESGQAALFSVALIPVILLAVLFVFNTGQQTAVKLKTQNAADAAAFSAMQMEARELNFIAYTNRAMVANQVAIGQTISLVSWGRYINSLGVNIRNVGNFAQIIPGVGSIIATITNAIAQSTNVLNQSIETASNVLLPALDLADSALSGSQEAYHLANGVFDPGGGNNHPGGAMTAVAEQVVKLNDANGQLNTIIMATNLSSYFKNRGNLLQRWGGDKEQAQNRMASMINASRDGFTSTRNNLPTPLLPVKSGNLYVTGWEFRRAGGSEIAKTSEGKFVWSGMDTLSLHVWARKGIILGGKKWIEIPLGYGASQTGNGSNFSYPGQYLEKSSTPQTVFPSTERTVNLPAYQDSRSQNAQGSNIAAFKNPGEQDSTGASMRSVGGDATRFSAGGINRYWDFNRNSPQLKDANGDPADVMPSYVVVVEHDRQNVRDASNALGIKQSAQDKTNISLAQDNPGKHIRSMAKAQAFFRRPASLWQRADAYDERANLFSPFWEARLVDLNARERSLYATLLGLQ
ncbi:hypothetical protein HF670_11340 [Acidithiobacillus thiooxidans]|nr:hypothetical protein [Acidithiobacillus thiooxidans]